MVKYTEIKCKTLLHHHKSPKLPYKWDINIYRGCEHACPYCFAIYSHKYLGYKNLSDFEEEIIVKANAPSVLEEELSKPSMRNVIINIGGICDSYQPAEEHYRIMPEILRVILRYENPIVISTKSDLILRDYELIKRLSEKTLVIVGVSIISMDNDYIRLLEPSAPELNNRKAIFECFKKSKVKLSFHCMPILPIITDNEENINDCLDYVVKNEIDGFIFDTLNLYGKTRERFFQYIKEYFPDLQRYYYRLYNNFSEYKAYRERIIAKLKSLINERQMENRIYRYIDNLKQVSDDQLELF